MQHVSIQSACVDVALQAASQLSLCEWYTLLAFAQSLECSSGPAMAAEWNAANAWWAADAAAAYAWRTAGDERAPADAAAAVDDAAVAAAIKDLKEQHQNNMAELRQQIVAQHQQHVQAMHQAMLQLQELAIATRASLQEQLAHQQAQQMFVASIAASQEQLAQQHDD